MPSEFSLNKIFRDAFGYDAPQTFTVPAATARKSVSDLGQPFYGTDALGREHFLPVYLNDILLPFSVIGISTKKTIINTPMPERGGSVHEIVSIEDYAINIKGILINDDNIYPEKDILQLHKLFKINTSVSLRCALTDIFLVGGTVDKAVIQRQALATAFNTTANAGDTKLLDQLHQVVIKEISYPAVSGVEHAKPFEIVCESDMIFTLEIE